MFLLSNYVSDLTFRQPENKCWNENAAFCRLVSKWFVGLTAIFLLAHSFCIALNFSVKASWFRSCIRMRIHITANSAKFLRMTYSCWKSNPWSAIPSLPSANLLKQKPITWYIVALQSRAKRQIRIPLAVSNISYSDHDSVIASVLMTIMGFWYVVTLWKNDRAIMPHCYWYA